MLSSAVITKAKERNYAYSIILLLLLIGCKENVDSNESDKNTLTKKQIIEIANEEATSRGFKVNIWTKVIYDVDNKVWKEYHPNIKRQVNIRQQVEPDYTDPYEILEKADFQAVHYHSRTPKHGGGLWVFVDRKTGKIITVYYEE